MDRMTEAPAVDLDGLAEKSHDVAKVLSLLSNQKRLLILCWLEAEGECRVNELAEAVALSQSALSQHLAKLRSVGLVVFRREGQSIRYSLADRQVGQLLQALKEIYCPLPPETEGSKI